MSDGEINNSLQYWDNLHKEYNRDDIKMDDWLVDFDSIILVTTTKHCERK